MSKWQNEPERLIETAAYLAGASDALQALNPSFSERLALASKTLHEVGSRMCGQGFYNCTGGPDCTSDHK